MDTAFETKKRNDGYGVKRLREILGKKQEALAEQLGVSQRTISKLESKEIIEDEMLEKIAVALNIPVEAIKNFSEDATINFVANTFHDGSYGIYNYQCSINPIEKIIELYNEKTDLYERMLQTEREKVALLEEVLKDRK